MPRTGLEVCSRPGLVDLRCLLSSRMVRMALRMFLRYLSSSDMVRRTSTTGSGVSVSLNSFVYMFTHYACIIHNIVDLSVLLVKVKIPTTRCPPPLILPSGISSCSSLTIPGIFISTPRLRNTTKSGPYPSVTIALPEYLRHSRSCTSQLVLPGGGNVMIRTRCHYILWSHRQQFTAKKININQLKMTKICHEIKIHY